MKRLVFCFDGTWNRLDAQCPTNVVLTAESVLPLTPDATAQVIFYDEGVGTSKGEELAGGMFGAGLVKNIADAYRFLIFNYTPVDEIYVFGFSRGAYTARSFVGMLHVAGILERRYASKAEEAVELYRRRDSSASYQEEVLCFRRDHSAGICINAQERDWRTKAKLVSKDAPFLTIKYLGVWDTVGALGIPARFAISKAIDRKYLFHDTSLSNFVASGRHAVAIDERREDFVPTLWDNVDQLNDSAGKKSSDADAPYQQKWFPGVHSAVGGGGERRGLSDQALDWILDGARAAGLVLDANDQSSPIYSLKPDYSEYIENSEEQSLYYKLANEFAAADRAPGPSELWEVSMSAQRRWLEDPKRLKDQRPYRPATLARVKPQLDKLDPANFGLGEQPTANAEYDLYEVKRGDTLSGIAKELLGDPHRGVELYKANLNKLDSPDRIYPGQVLRVPKH
ncbi:MAG TPA: DUF2235 domain-containing protein [Pseudolabrys sp.]|uniref:phospholipase effector Tle1 domain-containing protein n=1 Tax=Pseudolabrys sp. TaxID=1960880 RepID=UPI002DDD3A65|nr:DUF2235 domain-containing protein [Pseudolabrys sp.]HEV2629449.1 DUF2235 domain-containing protein [Pseudolabrys sp.]